MAMQSIVPMSHLDSFDLIPVSLRRAPHWALFLVKVLVFVIVAPMPECWPPSVCSLRLLVQQQHWPHHLFARVGQAVALE